MLQIIGVSAFIVSKVKIAPTQIKVKLINASLPYLKLKTNIISVVLLQKWSIRKKNNNKITSNPFIFLLSFQLVSSRHSHNCHTANVRYIFIKRQLKCYTKNKSCHSNNSNGKDLAVLFKMGLSRDISKFSLIIK